MKQEPRVVTLVFPLRDDRVLLGRKQVRFGKGRMNGFGGELLDGETPPAGGARELKEECGLIAAPDDLVAAGEILFTFDRRPGWSHDVHVFLAPIFRGEPRASAEMAELSWHRRGALPLKDMWPADRAWVPEVLAGRIVSGSVLFRVDDETGEIVGFAPDLSFR